MDRNQFIETAFICDSAYVLPTSVAITSIIASKGAGTCIRIHLVAVELTQGNLPIFRRFIRDRVEVVVHQVSMDKVKPLHTGETGSFCAATPAALNKFYLPEILAGCNRVLYLDGDIIVRGDLADLYGTDLEGYPLGAVVDSGSLYFKHAYVNRVKDYFNSGVMLMDLDMMRRMNATEALVNEKISSQDSMLIDQNIFNTVFDRQFRLLPIKYNCPYVSLQRARGKFTISQLNERYGTAYSTLDELRDDAVILHYSSKDKPWKNGNIPLGEEWLKYCHIMMDEYGIEPPVSAGYAEKTPKPIDGEPMVSVITPVYNLESYITGCVESILAQTLPDFEMICVDDGSTDNSLRILMEHANQDQRVRVIAQSNQGQSVARNHGCEIARGRYVYFLDGDDMLLPGALKELVTAAEATAADVVLFDGDTFYETEELRKQFPSFEKFYRRKQAYPGVTEGTSLFSRMVNNHDHRPAPGLYFIKRSYLKERGLHFREGVLHEDNLFAMQLLMQAARAAHTPSGLCIRRIRPDSVMTSPKTYNNYLGFLTVAVAIIRFLERNAFPQYALEAALQQLKIIIGQAKEIYQQMGKSARIKPVFPNCGEEIIANILISMIENATAVTDAMKEKAALEMEYKAAVEKAVKEKKALEDIYTAAAEKAAQEKFALEQKYATLVEKAELEKKVLNQKHTAETEKAARKKKALEHELAAIRSSYSYNIGRGITCFPRKFRDGIRYHMSRSLTKTKDKKSNT